ncbi:MAG: putative 4-hydroxybenzoate polyprenyltransferase [Proteobacteria bacterium]|nr:putative 4-hydroxybenzoate polyprenyltransferase [Pseudomonadota bacterium]MBU1231912.1 putative 4-hydroxybenzoate polyprenyltransferase [Pseudomonadota bacterium]MBU1419534.1 putative 4-hydroxybenzoate polyprenyltransferase [Pseudomonadota bacterium]MBU1456602.1 putative 4-hydroxybenzoate polyprenyltransferase [Pseudomonadota bacterium]
MLRKIAILLEMIKFKLTIFAMPFAFMGAFLAARGVPEGMTFLWVVLAMIGARTCAMGFNRIVDAKFDKANPRTADRAIPSGAVNMKEAWTMVILAGFLFFFAAWSLNPLTLKLAPFALGLTLFYSLTKRFTSFCHLILGVALAFSPLGGWVAVQGSLNFFPWALSAGVLFWVAGFDTVYACLDAEFDRKAGLHSLPSRLGRRNAFRLAAAFHVLAFALFTLAGIQAGLNYVYYIGIVLTAGALLYQHMIVNPNDLSKIQVSFFSMNGFISLALFAATWLSLLTEKI